MPASRFLIRTDTSEFYEWWGHLLFCALPRSLQIPPKHYLTESWYLSPTWKHISPIISSADRRKRNYCLIREFLPAAKKWRNKNLIQIRLYFLNALCYNGRKMFRRNIWERISLLCGAADDREETPFSWRKALQMALCKTGIMLSLSPLQNTMWEAVWAATPVGTVSHVCKRTGS